MKIFTTSLIVLSAAVCSLGANATAVHSFDAARFMYKGTSKSSAFSNPRLDKINAINSRMFATTLTDNADNAGSDDTEVQPDQVVPSYEDTGELETPSGETWFYTSTKEYDSVVHNEYFTEYFLKAYTYNIYDANMQLVGTISDKMRYGEDEIKVPLIEIIPLVTKNFFNDDDKYEIAVSLCINTHTPGIMHFRSVIYSIGGEKEQAVIDETPRMVDVPVSSIDGLLGDVLHAPIPSNPENYYLTFYTEHPAYIPVYPDEYPEGATNDQINEIYWQHVCEAYMEYYTFAKIPGQKDLQVIMRKNIMIQKLPGDQESSVPLITFVRNNEPYVLVQYYKETLSNPYTEPHIDPNFTMREANSLMIELYKFEGTEAKLLKTTEIPFVKDSADGVFYTWYSVGDLRYRLDIDFDNFNTGDLPAYYVTKMNFYLNENELGSYYVYDHNGNKLKTVFENAQSYSMMSDVEGFESQINFVNTIGGEFMFNFVDVPSCELKLSQCWKIDMGDDLDPERITANIDRTKTGNSYAYATEMRVPSVDEDDNNLIRVLWFDRRGNVMRIDEMNSGNFIYYAAVYIEGAVLDPHFFHADDEHEYMFLVKRGVEVGSTKSEEQLMICKPLSLENPRGKTLLHIGPHPEYGNISWVYTIPGESPALSVTYLNPDTKAYTRQLYYLPFGSSAIEEIESADAATDIRFDGTTLFAPGETIRVYTTQGVLLASAADELDTTGLASGQVLIVTAGKSVKKIAK